MPNKHTRKKTEHNLDTIQRRKSTMAGFSAHLDKSHCPEGLRFIKELDGLSAIETLNNSGLPGFQDGRPVSFKQIFRKYFKPESQYVLNISAELMKETHALYNSGKLDFTQLEKVKTEITTMLEHGPAREYLIQYNKEQAAAKQTAKQERGPKSCCLIM